MVQYVDTKGNSLDTKTLTGQVGKPWQSEERSFDGYTFKEVRGATSGSFTEATQEVTYVYYTQIPGTPIIPILKGDVVVQYVDTKGNVISDPLTLNGQVGKEWTSEQLEIDGYQFKEVTGSTAGLFTEATQEVTYVYYTQIPGIPSVPIAPDKSPLVPLEPSTPMKPDTDIPFAPLPQSTPVDSDFTEKVEMEKQERLPQTSMDLNVQSVYLGVFLIGLGILIAIPVHRKQKE